MEPIYGAIAIVLVAIVTGIFSWLVARGDLSVKMNAQSGKIDTSEAAKLWDEGTNMRVELREEVLSLKSQLRESNSTMKELTREIRISRDETERAQEEARKSREETRTLMAQIAELHNEVKTSNALTIGNLADNAETRRILLVPEGERSSVEKEHIDSANERQPQKDRPTVPKDKGEKNE